MNSNSVLDDFRKTSRGPQKLLSQAVLCAPLLLNGNNSFILWHAKECI